jgi:hypothetical protein
MRLLRRARLALRTDIELMLELHLVLICGSREWWDPEPIRREIRKRKTWCKRQGYELVIIEGEARGADQTARIVAEQEDVHVIRVAALWETRGKPAGPQRNAIMAAIGPQEVVAFHEDIENSKGTKDMLKRAEKLDIPTKVVPK